jgi:NTE family protein
MLLPAIDTRYDFDTRDGTRSERVLLTDGGVYDHLGISAMDPDRSAAYTTNVHQVDYVITCDAGHGVLDADTWPMWWTGRTRRSFETVYRKVQDAGKGDLFKWRESQKLSGFVMPYLGMNDHALPHRPPDLVTRDQVRGYPTNFSAMSPEHLRLLSTRGEQLTRLLLDWHCPEILR